MCCSNEIIECNPNLGSNLVFVLVDRNFQGKLFMIEVKSRNDSKVAMEIYHRVLLE